MSESRRLVVLDPCFASAVGHHADVNALLMPMLQQQGWRPELWADAAAAGQVALPGLRPLLRNGGYIDPRHWCDLAGSLHQAALLRPQLEVAAAGNEPVAVWLAHSLVPFQLIALAQQLQRVPASRVVVSLMFAPGELFDGQADLDLDAQRSAAALNARSALAALALACSRGRHQLLLCAGSQQLIERYSPLCAAVGLEKPLLHPALVVGDDLPAVPAAGASAPQQVLLHLGDRKPDKGRELALAVLERLLQKATLPEPLQKVHWWFHAASREPPVPAEAELLLRASADAQITVLEGPLPRPQLQQQLAQSSLALLPYCPKAYTERSSGVLWLYGAARFAAQQCPRVVGHAGGWMAAEAQALGLLWRPLPIQSAADLVFEVMAEALAAPIPQPPLSPYGQQVLGSGFGAWLVERLAADSL